MANGFRIDDDAAAEGGIDDRELDRTFDAKPDTFERVEVISGAARRRSWPLYGNPRAIIPCAS